MRLNVYGIWLEKPVLHCWCSVWNCVVLLKGGGGLTYTKRPSAHSFVVSGWCLTLPIAACGWEALSGCRGGGVIKNSLIWSEEWGHYCISILDITYFVVILDNEYCKLYDLHRWLKWMRCLPQKKPNTFEVGVHQVKKPYICVVGVQGAWKVHHLFDWRIPWKN